MSKKILFYIHSLNKGGAERVLLTVADEIGKDPDYDVVILTDTKDELEYPLPEGLKRITIDEDKSISSPFDRLKAIRKHVKTENPDRVIVFMLSSVIRAVIALRFTGYKIIAAVRSNPYDDYSKGKNRLLLLHCLRYCSSIVCQTKYQADFFKGKLRDRCVIISNPIFREFAQKAKELADTRKSELLTSDKMSGNIVATGRLFDYKNHRLLIEAFADLADDYEGVNVVIYGEGPYRSELEKLIESKKLKNRVFLLGDSEHVEQDISDALIYVLPSDTEGLPNALMEAMALGLPVISTDCPCGGPKSLIKDGVNGILVSVNDKEMMTRSIKRLLDDGPVRSRLGKEARKITETNELGRIVEEWKKLINE